MQKIWSDFKIDFDKIIGKGASATVYEAEQISLSRKCAVKVLNVESFTQEEKEEILQRFKNEARFLAQIEDPGIVSAIQAGENEGLVWFAMEYLDARTLQEHLDEGRVFTEEEVLKIGMELAKALNNALKLASVIHRDIKPGNIFLLGDYRVKIADFGIAGVMRDRETKLRLTKPGIIMGTPAYVSPEMVKGDQLDHRADIYSLGIVLHELLTQAVPFEGKSYMDVLYKHVNEDPEPPGSFVTASKGFDCLILTCLQKNPDSRYQTYDELIQDMQRVLETGTSSKVIRKKRPLAKPVIVASTLLITVFILYMLFFYKNRPEIIEDKKPPDKTSDPKTIPVAMIRLRFDTTAHLLSKPLKNGIYMILAIPRLFDSLKLLHQARTLLTQGSLDTAENRLSLAKQTLPQFVTKGLETELQAAKRLNAGDYESIVKNYAMTSAVISVWPVLCERFKTKIFFEAINDPAGWSFVTFRGQDKRAKPSMRLSAGVITLQDRVSLSWAQYKRVQEFEGCEFEFSFKATGGDSYVAIILSCTELEYEFLSLWPAEGKIKISKIKQDKGHNLIQELVLHEYNLGTVDWTKTHRLAIFFIYDHKLIYFDDKKIYHAPMDKSDKLISIGCHKGKLSITNVRIRFD